jgi:hypothetical protein
MNRNLAPALLVVVAVGDLLAGSSDSQAVSFKVDQVMDLALDSPNELFVIATFPQGGEAKVGHSTTYRIASNLQAPALAKITARLDNDMPPNTGFHIIGGDVPANGVAQFANNNNGVVTSAESDLIINIPVCNDTGLSLIYAFTASVQAAPGLNTRHLTLTLMVQ